jgi:hypothetical protein
MSEPPDDVLAEFKAALEEEAAAWVEAAAAELAGASGAPAKPEALAP